LLGALKRIVEEVDAFKDVMSTQGDFCAMVASHGTTSILEITGCTHVKTLGKVNFGISIDEMTPPTRDYLNVAIRFITLLWRKGEKEIVEAKSRKHMDEVNFKLFCVTLNSLLSCTDVLTPYL
jgi:hypothetical protein